MKHGDKKQNWIQRFISWLFGSPFRNLPSEYGDTVPAELRNFEAEIQMNQRRPWKRIRPDKQINKK